MVHSPSPLSAQMFPCLGRLALLFFHVLLLQPTFSAAYSWVLTAPATQCSNLSISIIGSDGVPPYSVLVVPFGPSPLSVDVRSVIDYTFSGESTTASFAINYPADSQFVAVVSCLVVRFCLARRPHLSSFGARIFLLLFTISFGINRPFIIRLVMLEDLERAEQVSRPKCWDPPTAAVTACQIHTRRFSFTTLVLTIN